MNISRPVICFDVDGVWCQARSGGTESNGMFAHNRVIDTVLGLADIKSDCAGWGQTDTRFPVLNANTREILRAFIDTADQFPELSSDLRDLTNDPVRILQLAASLGMKGAALTTKYRWADHASAGWRMLADIIDQVWILCALRAYRGRKSISGMSHHAIAVLSDELMPCFRLSEGAGDLVTLLHASRWGEPGETGTLRFALSASPDAYVGEILTAAARHAGIDEQEIIGPSGVIHTAIGCHRAWEYEDRVARWGGSSFRRNARQLGIEIPSTITLQQFGKPNVSAVYLALSEMAGSDSTLRGFVPSSFMMIGDGESDRAFVQNIRQELGWESSLIWMCRGDTEVFRQRSNSQYGEIPTIVLADLQDLVRMLREREEREISDFHPHRIK